MSAPTGRIWDIPAQPADAWWVTDRYDMDWKRTKDDGPLWCHVDELLAHKHLSWSVLIERGPLTEKAVSTQDAPSRPPLTPQSDAEGSGVAQDVREALGAQTGAQGASEAAYEAGVAEGRRQAVAAIRERVGDIAATEWAALIVEEEGRG